jgi:hypothetical protein
MTFDATKEYGNTILGEGFPSGKEYIEAIIQDAKKTLPPNTDFWFITWNEDGKRKAGWVYNLQIPRERQKLFNPLKPGESLRT